MDAKKVPEEISGTLILHTSYNYFDNKLCLVCLKLKFYFRKIFIGLFYF